MADVKIMKTAAENGLAELFASRKASLPGDAAAREEAFARFAEAGLPHRRVEEWKYTDLRAVMREAAPLASKPSAAEAAQALAGGQSFAATEAVEIAIIDGHMVEKGLALPAGVTVTSLSRALAENHPLLASLGAIEGAKANVAYALNAAFMTDGVVIHVAAGAEVAQPIHLRFAIAGESSVATATRTLLVVEEGASITLLESHASADGVGHQPNNVLEIVARDKAKVRHLRIDGHGDAALALSTLTAHLGAHVEFDTLNLVAKPAVSRHQVFMTFAGEHTNGGVRGTTMIKGSQHADTTLFVEHVAPHCESRELFKTVIDGEATGVFQGRIAVAQSAQKTDGKMMSACVMLSEGGTMNNKPELEIFADDVLCAHGATCGALDDDLLFYLMARGLPRKEAEALLLESFLGEPVEEALGEESDEALHGAYMSLVQDWLKTRA